MTRTLRRGALLLGSLALLGCQAEDRRPHLVLIVVDSLRADHLGAYGYARPTSPNIDRLAREGVLFTRAVAPSSWTKPSVASLFTSRRPSEHGAIGVERHLAREVPTLAQLLCAAGYRTLGVSGNFVHVQRETGLARGFESWKSLWFRVDGGEGDAILSLDSGAGRTVKLRAPTAAELNREVSERLPSPDGPPLFLYVHYMEPHAGYAPPERFRAALARDGGGPAEGVPSDAVVELARARARLDEPERRRLIDLYDAEIAAVDDAIGALLSELDRRGFGSNAVVTVVSDHGEEFGEHAGWFHGLTLHAESLAVPLVIRDRRRAGPGRRRDEPVDLLDVPTTLLALAGVEPARRMRGRNLLGAAPPAPRDLAAELHPDRRFEERVGPRAQRVALTRWPWKAIRSRDGSLSLYRLDRDRGEARPVSPQSPDVPPELLQGVAALERASAAAGKARPGALDAEALEGLRALGYAK